jgi:hypothetical protein
VRVIRLWLSWSALATSLPNTVTDCQQIAKITSNAPI